MEPRKIGHHLSSSKPPKICFLESAQSKLDRRHQSAFPKKRFCIHHVPPARAADKKIKPTKET